jgi:hypothetical protein
MAQRAEVRHRIVLEVRPASLKVRGERGERGEIRITRSEGGREKKTNVAHGVDAER